MDKLYKISDAIKFLKGGKKIRNINWPLGASWELSNGTTIIQREAFGFETKIITNVNINNLGDYNPIKKEWKLLQSYKP